MYLIEGSDLTTADDLKVGIHLSNAGAALFAQKLTTVIKTIQSKLCQQKINLCDNQFYSFSCLFSL
jgi:hypothetical protein